MRALWNLLLDGALIVAVGWFIWVCIGIWKQSRGVE